MQHAWVVEKFSHSSGKMHEEKSLPGKLRLNVRLILICVIKAHKVLSHCVTFEDVGCMYLTPDTDQRRFVTCVNYTKHSDGR